MNLKGLPISAGIAAGPAYVYAPFAYNASDERISPESATEAVEKYHSARLSAQTELNAVYDGLDAQPDKQMILQAHIDILFDEEMDEEICSLIRDEFYDGAFAVATVYDRYAEILSRSSDAVIKERAQDLMDVKNRLLRCWFGGSIQSIAALAHPCVIVAHDLFPSDTAGLDRENVLAIVTENGGSTSHSAILARSFGIPAVSGVAGAVSSIANGMDLVVDALAGVVITQPTEKERTTYTARREAFLKKAERTRRFLPSEPLTSDGTRVEIGLNIGSLSGVESNIVSNVDMVGLFRTEFLYMESDHLPNEDEQFVIYKKTLLTFRDKPVVLRTLDIGGDKSLPYLPLPKEDNPFLGNRALRLCLSRPEIFRTQLRAALRASVFGKLWIMLPMVSSLDDIRAAREVFESVKTELIAEGKEFSPDVKLGIMIEIPSVALISDIVATEVDFASIGSNDLCQYLTAADRMNPTVADYYQSYHPAVFKTIKYVVEQFDKSGKPICICGELGGDPIAAAILVGLGMRRLSMNAAAVAEIKELLSRFSLAELHFLSEKALSLATAGEIEAFIKNAIDI